jgi:predicted NBD/HSP70 family sugar kinase
MHARILRLINQSGPLSRIELVRLLGVSKATMSGLSSDLIARGMLIEGEMVYGAGRPSTRLELAAASASFIGVSLSVESLIICLTDLHGSIVGQITIGSCADVDEMVAALALAINDLLVSTGIDRDRVSGIGIAIPGLVDAEKGLCVRSTHLGWRAVTIGPMITKATGLPAFVENDANALALGEHLFGNLRGSDAGVVISVGDGIGCGLIINGDLHRGVRGGAGEISHATIELNGLPCKCGKRGCLDTVASTRSILNFAREAGLPENLAALDAAADRGDQTAIAILHRAGTALGLAASQLIQTLDPARIIIALSEGPLDGPYARFIRQTIDANVMPGENRRTDIAMVRIGREAWAIGAASAAAGRSLFQL